MSSGEVFGYIASALVFMTFYMRTMLPLRIAAMVSNVAFIAYALIDGLTPRLAALCMILMMLVPALTAFGLTARRRGPREAAKAPERGANLGPMPASTAGPRVSR